MVEGIVTWAGLKGGYTDSQMNFWSGDFQFSATAPQRTVALAGYEFKLNDAWTFTLAYETGLADITSRRSRTSSPSIRKIRWRVPSSITKRTMPNFSSPA